MSWTRPVSLSSRKHTPNINDSTDRKPNVGTAVSFLHPSIQLTPFSDMPSAVDDGSFTGCPRTGEGKTINVQDVGSIESQ